MRETWRVLSDNYRGRVLPLRLEADGYKILTVQKAVGEAEKLR